MMRLLLVLLLMCHSLAATGALTPTGKSTLEQQWVKELTSRVKAIDSQVPGKKLGLFVKDLSSGQEFSFRADESWYIASGTKLPIAIAVMRLIDNGALTLGTKVEVTENDYIDGAGELNYIRPGSQVSVRLLLEQSLIFSDNTATDLLIRVAGLESVNALTNSISPKGFGPITTLADVRRKLYGEIHPNAQKLSNMDFIRIKTTEGDEAKLEKISTLLSLKLSDLRHKNLDSAYQAYYETRYNSASLRSYGHLLEKFSRGELLKPESQKFLMSTLVRVETGKARIKAGLPKSFVFAHKTGTQHGRICDFGIISDGKPSGKRLAVAACVRGVMGTDRAEKQLSQVGQAIYQSGFFEMEIKK